MAAQPAELCETFGELALRAQHSEDSRAAFNQQATAIPAAAGAMTSSLLDQGLAALQAGEAFPLHELRKFWSDQLKRPDVRAVTIQIHKFEKLAAGSGLQPGTDLSNIKQRLAKLRAVEQALQRGELVAHDGGPDGAGSASAATLGLSTFSWGQKVMSSKGPFARMSMSCHRNLAFMYSFRDACSGRSLPASLDHERCFLSAAGAREPAPI